MKQTAVEWLLEQITEEFAKTPSKITFNPSLIKQAKEMEKQQIIEAIQDTEVFIRGYYNEGAAEQYYNETFKSE